MRVIEKQKCFLFQPSPFFTREKSYQDRFQLKEIIGFENSFENNYILHRNVITV